MVQSNGWCTTTSIKLPLLLGSWLSLCTLHTAHNAASPLFPSYWTTLRQFRAIQDLADTTGQPARRDWNKFKCVRKVTEKCEESDRKVKQNFFSVTFSVNVFTFFCHFPHAFEFTSIPSSGRPGILLHNKLSCSPPVFLVYLGIFVASMVLVNSRSSLAEVWRGGGGVMKDTHTHSPSKALSCVYSSWHYRDYGSDAICIRPQQQHHNNNKSLRLYANYRMLMRQA